MSGKEPSRVQRALAGDRSVTVTRAFALDDIQIRSAAKGGDGRTVDAYAAVFSVPQEIVDQDGHYLEQNAPTCFNKSLADRTRSIFSVYNHAKNLQGQPSDLWSVPIGKPLVIKPDSRGLFTSTRYNPDPDSDRILEAIKSGSITGMSYTGVFLRSDPELQGPFATYAPNRAGDLTLVTRQEIALIEYGPTPIPAYESAVILGVRNREVIRVAGKMKPDPDNDNDATDDDGYGAPDSDAEEMIEDLKAGRAKDEDAGMKVNAARADGASDDDDVDEGERSASDSGWSQKAGKWVFDPDGDGDDDSSAATDSDHDFWAVDGTQLKAIPPNPATGKGGKPMPAKKGRADEGDDDESSRSGAGSWDGPAAMSKAASSGDPAKALASICAGRKSGDPSTEAAYALPHHDTPGGPPNPAGVSAALGRLNQTKGLTNASAAKAHLEAHESALKGGKGDTSSTSSSGRTPADTDDATSRTTEAGQGTGEHSTPGSTVEPPKHSANDYTKRSATVGDNERMTVDERVARQAVVRLRLSEIDSQYMGAELPQDTRTEWKDLQEELIFHDRAIADATERAEYLRTLTETNSADETNSEGVDRETSGYGTGSRSGGYRTGAGTSAPIKRSGGYVSRQTEADIFDLAAIRNRARNFDEVPVLMREAAMRAVEISHFPQMLSREDAQTRIESMLANIDDDRGTLARRILTTGSKAYDRAFGKVLVAQSTNSLTAEESRALQLGTDAAGGFAVPFQLDPTVLLTSNGAINPLRQISRVEQITGKEWDGVTTAGITVSRVAEGTEAGSADAVFAQPSVRTTRVQGFVPFNIELDVSWGALRSQMTSLLMDAKDIEEASSFALGSGTAPAANGIVSTLGTASVINTAATATLAVKDLYSLENALAPRFRQQAAYLASKTIYNVLRQAFQANASAATDFWVRPQMGTPAELNGYPAYEASVMAATTTSASKVILQGDFKQFLIVDRVGMGIELVPHLFGATNRYPTGQRGILAIWFNNSQILVPNAFRLLTVL